MSRAGRFRISTFQVIVLGFAALILGGAGLLMLPAASRTAGGASFSDCLFTATSAVCVTGLVVKDTAQYWTPFGQTVILALIQIGGMGVVTVAGAVFFLSGRRIGLMHRSLMQESISAHQVGGMVRIIRLIITGTILFELAGAGLMFPSFYRQFGLAKGIWYALFHSVSAFCNAGFDLMGALEPFSSMTAFVQDPAVNIALTGLIVIGGIGFLTWDDMKKKGIHIHCYQMQTKLILLTTLALLAAPAVYFAVYEMQDLPLSARILPALMQSATLRTAGFNTLDLAKMGTGTDVLMIACMLAGGSPGSTAGGMKTTTVAVLLLAALSEFGRKDSVECLGRRIPEDAVRSAVAILLLYSSLFMAGGILIHSLEDLPLLSCLFESASAIGTVGLTLGITSQLGTVSRLVLIGLMFFGRVGPLTLIYAARPAIRPARRQLPLEKITVG